MVTRRQERVAHRIIQEVSEAIRALKDPRIGFVTITSAFVSPDLHDARVFISVLGEVEEQDTTLAALQHSARHLQSVIARPLGLKVTPRLEFVHDHTVQRADEMSRLIAQARASDPNPGPETGSEAAPADGDARSDEDAPPPPGSEA